MAEAWEVRGMLIVFGMADLVGDVFSAKTEFFLNPGKPREVPIYYHHGLDDVLDRAIGEGEIKLVNEGIAIKARIDLPNGYGAAMRRLIRDGLLGWSSGSAGHVVRRTAGNGVQAVEVWPIVEASLTPSPMMPVKASRVLMKRFDYNEAALEMIVEMERRRAEILINRR